MPCGSVMSWMQSNVVTKSTEWSVGQRLVARVDEPDVVGPLLAPTVLGPLECVLRDVVADERAVGERLGHQQHRSPGAAADVGDRDAGVEPFDDAVECRQHRRDQVMAVPRFEAALDADRTLRGRGCRSRGRRRCGSSRASPRARPSSAGTGGTSPSRTPGWSGEASTAIASGVSQNVLRCAASVSTAISFAAAWL
jgi:hypothetical protein